MSPVPLSIRAAARSLKSRRLLAVLIELHEALDAHEFRKVPVALIARHLAMTRENHVHVAVRELVVRGFLEEGPKLGNASTFRLVNATLAPLVPNRD